MDANTELDKLEMIRRITEQRKIGVQIQVSRPHSNKVCSRLRFCPWALNYYCIVWLTLHRVLVLKYSTELKVTRPQICEQIFTRTRRN
jgi:hypothetical protein